MFTPNYVREDIYNVRATRRRRMNQDLCISLKPQMHTKWLLCLHAVQAFGVLISIVPARACLYPPNVCECCADECAHVYVKSYL